MESKSPHSTYMEITSIRLDHASAHRRPRTRSRQRPRRRSLAGCLRFVGVLVFLLAVLGVIYWFVRPQPRRIGIIAGHWQYDSGAVCDDGLREADITLAVAQRTAELIRQQGYQVDILPEYGAGLQGFRGLALISLHVDSCIPGLSGYKTAGAVHGLAGAESALLVSALNRSYAAASGLSFHENTVTPAMTEYHAFGQINGRTPAAIIELGFLSDDRELLTAHQDRVAQGVADGVMSYLKAKAEQKANSPARP
jgi:N-acetylmuramoyl-L-alanine amidase